QAAVALPAVAQAPAPAECSAPSFSFKWIGQSSVHLIAKAKPAARYRVWIEESQRSPRQGQRMAVAVNNGDFIYASNSDAGEAYAVDMTGLDLLASAGRTRIWYVPEKPCPATQASAVDTAPLDTVAKRFHLIDDAFLQALRKTRWFNRGSILASYAAPTRRNEAGQNVELYQADGVVALEPHHLSIDVGPVFVMKSNGSFETDTELALTGMSRWLDVFAGALDLRISSLNLPGSSAPASPPSAGEPPLSLASSTIFEAAARAIGYPWGAGWNLPAFGVVGGVGVRSLPAEFMNLKGNLFGGFRLQVAGYNAGNPGDSLADTNGFLELGFARDGYWLNSSFNSDQRNRLYAEGQLEIPGLGGENVRVLMRVRSSTPVQFDGPSELRLSALVSINPAVFRTIFGLAK
ncbi:MAG TPA: hypothetical protein VFP52_06935, partial [Myxococcales bacterium]|nr:hypothetical protein [Myxococcales bacterium]